MGTYQVQINDLCKLENYRSGPLDADPMDVDADPMDGVRGLSVKKGQQVGGLSAKKFHLSPNLLDQHLVDLIVSF